MIIRALELLAFGPFTERILELQGNGPHLVYGPNEAGKSSALRALNAFFFGIPLRTDDDFIHGKPSLRVGMHLESGDGSSLHLHRIKRQKDTLIRASDGSVVKEGVLSRMLGGLSDEFFKGLYGLDHAGLEQGAAELLQGRGELGSALFAAGAGLVNLYQTQQALDRNTGELFKPGGKKNSINRQKKEYADLRRNVREVQAGSGEWESHLSAKEEAEKEKERLEGELQDISKEKSRLEYIKNALPDIVRRGELQQEREILADVRLLPEEFAGQRRDAVMSQQIAADQCTRLRKELDALHQELAGLHSPPALLAAGEDILRLNKDLNRIRSQRGETLKLRQSLADVRARLQELSQALPDSLKQQQGQPAVERALETRVGKLIDSGTRLQTEQQQCAELLRQRTQEAQQARGALESLDAGKGLCGLAELAVVVESYAHRGDTEQRLAEAELENRQQLQGLQNDLSRQTRWTGSPEALPSLALPDETLIEQYQDLFQQHTAALQHLEEELRQVRADLVAISADMDAFAAGEAIPDQEELHNKRRHRDEGWKLVLDAWEHGMHPDQAGHEYVAGSPGAADLPQAYAQAVEEADSLADRLRREAERVAGYAVLKSRLQVAGAAENETRARIEQTTIEQKRTMEAWQAVWQPLGITPGTPQEMRAWTRKMGDNVRRAAELEQGRARAAHQKAQLREMRTVLVRRMTEAGFSEPDQRTGFGELLAWCRKKIQELQKIEQHRAHLEKQQRTVADRLAQQQENARQLEEKQRRWQSEWAEAVSVLGLDARAYPEEARDVLNLLREMHVLHGRMLEEQGRLEFLQNSLQAFAVESRELVARVAPELLPAELPEDHLAELDKALAELDTRLSRARQTEALRTEGLKRRAAMECKVRETEQSAALAETQLRALCELAGCAAAEELGPALERSERLRACISKLEETEERLRNQSMGLSLDDFVRLALEQDAALLAPRLELLERRLTEGDERRSALDRTIGSEQAALDRMRGEDDAARLADDAEAVLAGMAESVQEYISLVIAQKMLRQAMESYRDNVQGGIIGLAGEFFRRITLDSFCGVRVENHGSGDMLVGLRTHTSAGVRVEAMSSGSRDQLFLALRLASLSSLLDEAEPMPLILDDILVNFDDRRTAETLQLLQEFSQRTQVVYFTHHQHIKDLAEGWRQHRL